MVPYLERTLELSREYSSYFASYKHVADPHIDDADEGMTTASTHKLFEELETYLVPIVRAICEQPAADDLSCGKLFPKQDSSILLGMLRSAWATMLGAVG